MATTLNRNQYEALRSLLSELVDVEDTKALCSQEHYAVHGHLSKDNLNELLGFMDMEVLD